MTADFPLIDISPFVQPGSDPARRARVVAAIETACTKRRVLAITGTACAHGVDGLVAASYASSTCRWTRNCACAGRSRSRIGLYPARRRDPCRGCAASTRARPQELFAIGPFDLPDEPYFTGPAAYPSLAPNLWPAQP